MGRNYLIPKARHLERQCLKVYLMQSLERGKVKEGMGRLGKVEMEVKAKMEEGVEAEAGVVVMEVVEEEVEEERKEKARNSDTFRHRYTASLILLTHVHSLSLLLVRNSESAT